MPVPSLSSRSSATAKLYLCFDGRVTASFSGGGPYTSPAYGDAGDSDKVTAIWRMVANWYRIFNLDVTTVDPAAGDDNDNISTTVAIGGTSAGVGAGGAYGTSLNGSFYNISKNAAFVYSDSIEANFSDALELIAVAIAHEAGHGFGLQHHTSVSGSIMEGVNAATLFGYGTWGWRNAGGQDDFAVIGGANNAFYYADPDGTLFHPDAS